MANPNPSPATRFTPGNPGSGRAKQKGARDRLSAALLTTFAEHFEEHGKAAIERVFAEDPTAYLRIAATIIPKEIEMADPFENLAPDDLDRVQAVISEALRERKAAK